MKKKILITGGTGFVGSNLVKNLAKNKKLTVLTRKKIKSSYNVKYLNCDLKSKKQVNNIFKKEKPDIVYHFAWEGIPIFNLKYLKKNILISNNLISAVNTFKCKKIIIAGSCNEYPYKDYYFKNKENSPSSKKLNILGKQKNHIKYIFTSKLKKDVKLIWSRIFYVYGPGQRNGSLLSSLIEKYEKKEKFILKNSSIYNDYIFIDDVVSALKLLIKVNKNMTINICSSIPCSNHDFIKKFAKITKTKKSMYKIYKKKKIYLVGSNELLKLYGWNQNYNLITGIKKTLNARRQNLYI